MIGFFIVFIIIGVLYFISFLKTSNMKELVFYCVTMGVLGIVSYFYYTNSMRIVTFADYFNNLFNVGN